MAKKGRKRKTKRRLINKKEEDTLSPSGFSFHVEI